jgi:hypothetical protein
MALIPVMPAKAGIQNPIIGESIWTPAYAGMTKDAIHPRFKKRGILAYLRKSGYRKPLLPYCWCNIPIIMAKTAVTGSRNITDKSL